MLETVLKSLDDSQAADIVSVNLEHQADFADYMVIASGRSSRHVSSIAKRLAEELTQIGAAPLGVEGATVGDWVLVDAGEIVIHIFRPEVRGFYALEKMWDVDEEESDNSLSLSITSPDLDALPALS